jgi:hypothetical protein
MTDIRKAKPADKKPSARKAKLAKAKEKKSPLGGRSKAEEKNMENIYPGITEQINRFEEAELPSCPHCGSNNTASVQVGFIGRTITLAASTRKVKLVPNVKDRLGKYFCNNCDMFFD